MPPVVLIGGLAALVLAAGCHRPPARGSVPIRPGPVAKTTTPALSKTAPSPAGQGTKPASAPARADVLSRPGPNYPVREWVRNPLPASSEADAEEDVVRAAADTIARRLAELDPPVYYRPSEYEVRDRHLRKTSRTVRPLSPDEQAEFARHGIETDRVYVEYEVIVTADQVRELRMRSRVGSALVGFLVIAGVLATTYILLRLRGRPRVGRLGTVLSLIVIVLTAAAVVAWRWLDLASAIGRWSLMP